MDLGKSSLNNEGVRKLTAREITDKIGCMSLQRFKRYIRAFLPPDPAAGQRQGMARYLTAEEGFLVYLGAELVGRGAPSHAVKEMLPLIDDYLKKEGYFPIQIWRYGEQQTDPVTELHVLLDRDEKFTIFIETVMEEKFLRENICQKTYSIDVLTGMGAQFGDITKSVSFSIKTELGTFCTLCNL